jgi:hypothetical protein
MTTSRRTRTATGIAAFACLVALTFAIQATASGSHSATAAPSVDQSSLNVPAEPQISPSGDDPSSSSSGSSGDGSGSSSDGSGSFDDGSGSSSDGSGSFGDGSGSFDNGSGSFGSGSNSAPTVDPGSAAPQSGTS